MTPPRKRLRLVKLVVQPHFVTDDGDSLAELVGEPMVIPSANLDIFVESFKADLERAEAELNADPAEPS